MDGRALIVLVLLGIAAAPLGVWVLLFRSSFAAESLAHGMVPGLVAATALGASLLAGGVAGAAVAAAVAGVAGRDARLGTDTGISIATTTLFGAGALLAAAGLADEHELEPLLFGDLDSLPGSSVAAAAALAAGVPLALAVMHRRLTAQAFEQRAAPLVVLVLLALVVAVVADAVGALLALALVVGPAAAALAAAGRLGTALLAAAVIATAAAAAGLALAEPLDVPAAATVALAAVAGVPLAWALRAAHPRR